MQSCFSFLCVGLKSLVPAHRRRFHLALAFAAGLPAMLAAGLPAQAGEAVTVVTKYEVQIAGIPLGSLSFAGNLDERTYSLAGRGDSSRLVNVVAKYEAHAKSAGALVGAAVLPTSYELNFRADDKKQLVDMRFSRGAIDQLAVYPPVKPSNARIPLEPGHRVGVIDPVSALILPLPEGEINSESACNRRMPIFDGRYRYDIVLSYKRTESIDLSAESGGRTNLFVCKIKYEPIAGHKPTRKSTLYWQANEGMEIWLAPVAAAGIFVPYRVVAPARIGSVVLILSKFKVSKRQQQAAISPDQ